jgi:hypothetical protein
LKRILIISPYFPPTNAADMQRIRMSLPYFEKYGWEAEVVTIYSVYSDMVQDHVLEKNLPKNIKIHYVNAFSKKWTSRLGLGSIGLRSLWFYKQYVNQLFNKKNFDLIYFSTTQFPILILGSYWKKKFNIPYVIDMQDPWHSDYYEDKPKNERPAKYWFSYRLNKYLEPIAMKSVAGLIAVSQAYIDTLQKRYPHLQQIPNEVITFGAFQPDFELVKSNLNSFKLAYTKEANTINLVYIGRGGHDLKEALTLLFTAFKKGLIEKPIVFEKLRFHFIGTSYAPQGEGIHTIKPIAEEMGISKYVNEQTDRISFYDSIYNLLRADALLIIGSDDPQYTASKIYPYILSERPLLAFFHPASSATQIIEDTNAGCVVSLKDREENAISASYDYLSSLLNQKMEKPRTNWQAFEPYSAENMTKQQCLLFNQIIG